MSRVVFLLGVCATLFTARDAAADAWLLQPGGGFAAFSTRLAETEDRTLTETRIYVTYGVSSRVTLGFSANAIPGPEGFQSLSTSGDAHLFARLPLVDSEATTKIATELGFGTRYTGTGFEQFLKPTLSFGRGLTLGKRSGWAALDASLILPLGEVEQAFKLDATLGVNLNDQWQVMGQAFYERDRFGQITTYAPSLTWAPKKGNKRYVVSFEQKTGRADERGVVFGVWQDF